MYSTKTIWMYGGHVANLRNILCQRSLHRIEECKGLLSWITTNSSFSVMEQSGGNYSSSVFKQSFKKNYTKKCFENAVITQKRHYCTVTNTKIASKGEITILDKTYHTDEFTNVTPYILSRVNERLQCQNNHPLNLLMRRIQNHFYKNYFNKHRNPLFSMYDSESPVVTLAQNFDTLLIPADHVSRKLSDSYYINKEYMLRAHTSAHQADFIRSGLDAFLMFGDVYRRDEIDKTHFPVFHQCEGVRLYDFHDLYGDRADPTRCQLLEHGEMTMEKQDVHTRDTAILLESHLKRTLEKLTCHLFGDDIEMRWVSAYFPFTHPSWELEINFKGEWLEVLGCGTIKQELLNFAGAGEKVGWAFGLGLERLAMRLYQIPDIRAFWSKDSGFTSQFKDADPDTQIIFKTVSKQPHCKNDIAFWTPENFSENDFYDLVRSVGGDIVEQVTLFDKFVHPKTQKHSQAYSIIYRHMDKPLTQDEVNVVHEQISNEAESKLNVEIRRPKSK